MNIRSLIAALPLVFIVGGTPSGAWAQDQAGLLNEARDRLQSGQAREALDRFQRLIDIPSLHAPALFGAAEASTLLERPDRALDYYRQVLEWSGKSPNDERRALFGSARMLVWLGRYPDAEMVYRQLLGQELNARDADVARAGLMKTLSLQNRPMTAYDSMPEDVELQASARFQRARAALWAGWPDKAHALLETIDPVSEGPLAEDIERLRLEVADELGNPLSIRFDGSRDSDNFTALKTEVTVGKQLPAMNSVSVVLQSQSFDQDDRKLNMQGIQGRYAGRLRDHVWLSLQGGVGYYGDRRTGLWSGDANFRPLDRFAVQVGAGREVVESFASFDRDIVLDRISTGVEYGLTHRAVLSGLVYGQRFSDANERLGASGKFALVLSETIGLSAQLRTRYFKSSRDDVVGYFNPESFHEESVVLVLRRRLNPVWRFEVLGGPGIQTVKPGERSGTSLIEARVSGRLSGCLSSSFTIGYSDSAVSSPSGFDQYYGQVFVSCPW